MPTTCFASFLITPPHWLMFSFSNCTSLRENLLKARNSSRRHFPSPVWQKSSGSVLILYLHNSIWAKWQIVTAHNFLVWSLITDSLLPCYGGKGKRGRAATNKCIKLNCKHLPRRKNNLDWLPYLCFLLQKLVLSAAGKQIRIFWPQVRPEHCGGSFPSARHPDWSGCCPEQRTLWDTVPLFGGRILGYTSLFTVIYSDWEQTQLPHTEIHRGTGSH